MTLGPDSRAVLQLVKDESADLLVHLGDSDDNDPVAWEGQLNSVLGEAFPYLAVIGSHGEENWPAHQAALRDRLSRLEGANCAGDYGVKSACTYRGLFFLMTDAGTAGSEIATYITEQLQANSAIWSICAWQKNQREMQVGGNEDEPGWDVYEACRAGGALIATGHERSYSRTKTGGGSTFAFVSGLGGDSIREQQRCQPVTPPYGCRGIWAMLYTKNQAAQYGALFIDFGVDGDPARARGYFKNIRGEVVDSFTVVSQQ
jgi:hypothetical protein